MATQPQDHLPKKSKDKDPDEYFTFTVGDQSFTMPSKTLNVINTGFIRRNRRRDEVDYTFTAIEALAGDEDSKEYREIFAALDPLSRQELKPIMEAFQAHLGATLGE